MEQRFVPEERQLILRLARTAIDAFLLEGREVVPPFHDVFLLPAAAFVSLKLRQELRGCMGSLDPGFPLGKTIVHCSISAAFRDPRFPPLTQAEFEQTTVEVSVLSPFRAIQDPEQIEVGLHGLCLTFGGTRGLLLPQVATEYKWDRYTFLKYTCFKAGLPADAWRHSSATLEIFSAEVFGENDFLLSDNRS